MQEKINQMTTHERLMQALTSQEREEYDKEYQELLFSELTLAIKAQDVSLVKDLQKMIDENSSSLGK